MSFVKGTLILTFSLREKELVVVPTNEFAARYCGRLPLPEGEGRGEGHALKRFVAIKGWI
jgi:hypothetical protein